MTSSIRLLPALLLLAHAAAHAIVNGVPATSSDPIARSAVMVACIESRQGSDQIVGSASGVIVGADLVLTAAHIFSMCKLGPGATDDAIYRWELRFGLEGAASTAAVSIGPAHFRNEDASRLMSPLDVDHDTFKDYAFVQVPGGIPAGMRPMRVAPKATVLAKGSLVYLSGYGFTHRHGTDYRLRTVRLPLTSVDAASPAMPPLDPDLNAWDKQHYMDFHSRTRHACLGDSGGPFYVVERGEPVLVAMLTHIQTVRGRAFCKVPAIGMRIDAVSDEMLRILERSNPMAER